MKNFLLFIFLIPSICLAQENLFYPLYYLLPQFQNPAAIALDENARLNATYGDYGLENNKNYFISYEHPLKKNKAGIGASYFMERNYLSNSHKGSIAYSHGAQISEESFLKIGAQFSVLYKKSFFDRIPTGVFTPVAIDPNFPTTTLSDFDVDLDFGIWYRHKKLEIGLSYRHMLAPTFKYGDYLDIQSKPLYFLFTAYRIEISDEFMIQTASNTVLGERETFINDLSATFSVRDTYFVGVNIRPYSGEDLSNFGLSAGLQLFKIKTHLYYMPKTSNYFGTTIQLLVQYTFSPKK